MATTTKPKNTPKRVVTTTRTIIKFKGRPADYSGIATREETLEGSYDADTRVLTVLGACGEEGYAFKIEDIRAVVDSCA